MKVGTSTKENVVSAKYYTQFILTDREYKGGNEFCGVVELNMAVDEDSDDDDIRDILARNFDLEISSIKLVAWSRLH